MIIGIDEVGRGCWAGPLVAGAVELDAPIKGLTDSKALSKKRREQLDLEIRASAHQYALGWVSAAEVDELGLTQAVQCAMQRAVAQIQCDNREIIIDGNINFLPELSHSKALIQADLSIPAVSAASIIAKVARDAYMADLANSAPGYGFEHHVGYGTKAHSQALARLGVLPDVHRMSYKPIMRYL